MFHLKAEAYASYLQASILENNLKVHHVLTSLNMRCNLPALANQCSFLSLSLGWGETQSKTGTDFASTWDKPMLARNCNLFA